MKHAKGEITECPLCYARMRPVYEGERIICKSCKRDLKPYIDAYVEYVKVRAEQNGMSLEGEA